MSAPERVGMMLDLSRCIGCRACQVACREWNQLEPTQPEPEGRIENPTRLDGDTWKQVKFLETTSEVGQPRWLFYSDSCKHCFDAPCMKACPTGAIGRTEQGVIRVDKDVCNGNGHCVPACPFGVIGIQETTGVAQKCTMCEERIGAGREPACSSVCPTDCIEFGPREDLVGRAEDRVEGLRQRGVHQARVYGKDELGGLGVLYVLADHPEVYGLPVSPVEPRTHLARAWGHLFGWLLVAAALVHVLWPMQGSV